MFKFRALVSIATFVLHFVTSISGSIIYLCAHYRPMKHFKCCWVEYISSRHGIMVLSTFWLWMPGVILGKHSYQINVNVSVPATVLSYESCYTIPGIKSFPLCIEIHLSSKRKQLSMDQSSFREHKKLHIERRYERNWEIVPVKSWQGIFCKFVSAIAGHALSSCLYGKHTV